MNRPSLLLIGAGGHAHACIDVIEQHGVYKIAGLIGMSQEVSEQRLGYSVIGTNDDLPELARKIQYALITVGQIQTPAHRVRLLQQAEALGFQMPTIISPSAYISRHASIGAGTIVMHSAIINAAAEVGKNCIINTKALIDHDAIIGDHCHISTGATLNGDVYIGAGSFIGSCSVIKQGVSIGISCIVGMGLAVRHDLSDHTRYIGKDKT